MSSERVLVICQVYAPDPAAVGQHMADACAELARRGNAVRVLAGTRGYDEPRVRYAARETRDGVDIRRLRWCSLGKGSMLPRVLGGMSFTVQTLLVGLFGDKPDTILVSTVPPMAPLSALLIAGLRRSRLVYWVMDLNPDQALVLGRAKPKALHVLALEWLQRAILQRAVQVVALDRFMAARLRAKAEPAGVLSVLPPWPLQSGAVDLPHATNPFRIGRGFGKRVVIMYSGNHSLAHPLDTLLDAARELRNDPDLLFVFVGGGAAKSQVDALVGPTILSLPYQPLDGLRDSLSAADVHVVVMGNGLVGISHPCKIYGAMAVSRPVLYFGPTCSHIGDLLQRRSIGWIVEHGDVAGAVKVLREIASMPRPELAAMGRLAGVTVTESYGLERLRAAFCDMVVPPEARGTNDPGIANGRDPHSS